MAVPGRYIFAALALILLPGAAAFADCGSCVPPPQDCGCTPPPPPPPPPCNCHQPPPHSEAHAQAAASATAAATARVRTMSVAVARTPSVVIRNRAYVGGEADVGVVSSMSAWAEAGLRVEASADAGARKVVVGAVCVNEAGASRAAVQTFRAPDVDRAFAGEVYRCISPARMRVSLEGHSFMCASGEALWHENGRLECRPQIARAESEDRALMTRFGAGDKLVHISEAAMGETRFTATAPTDGGVGRSVW